MTPADIAPVIAENVLARQAFGAALLSLDGLTQSQFAAKYSEADVGMLLVDPGFVRQVESFAANPAVQEYALDAQLRRGLSESVTGLVAKIQAPDTNAATLASASDMLTKISSLLDRREAAKRDLGEQGLVRHLSRTHAGVRIKTIEGLTEFKLFDHLAYEQDIGAVRAMRCTTESEAGQVIAALRSAKPMAILNLSGF
jgi:hypothetical protein